MCCPEKDASEKNTANTGELSVSISCAASNTIPEFTLEPKARSIWRMKEVPGSNLVYSFPLY
jgi:hypothetical protein